MKGRDTNAFSLVELTLAIGVAAFCLLALIALILAAQTSHIAASEQTGANDLTSELLSDLIAAQKTTPPSSQTSPSFGLSVGKPGDGSSTETLYFREGGEVIGPPQTNANGVVPAPRYRATIFLMPPGSGRGATLGRILITWPALADPNPSTLPSRYNGSFETFVALDRN